MFFCRNTLQIVKEKDRFRKAPPNYAMKKTQLLKDKVKEMRTQSRLAMFTVVFAVPSRPYFSRVCRVCRPWQKRAETATKRKWSRTSWTSWRREPRRSTDRGPRTSLQSGAKAALVFLIKGQFPNSARNDLDVVKATRGVLTGKTSWKILHLSGHI